MTLLRSPRRSRDESEVSVLALGRRMERHDVEFAIAVTQDRFSRHDLCVATMRGNDFRPAWPVEVKLSI